MLSDDDLKELGVLESDTHLEGIKRFSEFLKFQDVLLSSPLAIYIKGLHKIIIYYNKFYWTLLCPLIGLTLPDKHNLSNIVSKLPFTSSEPDTAMIIERKQGLEKYLQVYWSYGCVCTDMVIVTLCYHVCSLFQLLRRF